MGAVIPRGWWVLVGFHGGFLEGAWAKGRVEGPLGQGKELIRHGKHQLNGGPDLERLAAIT